MQQTQSNIRKRVKPKFFSIRRIFNFLLEKNMLTWILLVIVWQFVSLFYAPTFLPGPIKTLTSMKELIVSGNLFSFTLISLRRVIIGWVIGVIIAIPLGIIIGRINFFRKLMEPIINFFRFIPGLAFLTLFLMWFGTGELSKEILILYGVIFTVTVNTIAGVVSVSKNRINSARILGASEWQIIRTVIFPSVVPFIFTGARIGLGGAFASIVAAEMIAANEGLGYLIYTSRLYFHTDWIFVGIIFLGFLGFLSDKFVCMLGKTVLKKYNVNESVKANN